MPKRYQANVQAWVYRYLVLRYGERCHYCGIGLDELRERARRRKYLPEVFDIDHFNGDKSDDNPENLRLACRKCNVSRENRSRAVSSPSVCVYESKEAASGTRINKTLVGYTTEVPATMAANGRYEIPFRNWIYEYIRLNGFITKREAATAGAEAVGCSPATAGRYLDKMTSITGLLTFTADLLGFPVIVFKPEFDPNKGGDK